MKVIKVKYQGPTDTKGARLKASDGDNSLIMAVDYSLDGERLFSHAALAFIEKMGWNVEISGSGVYQGDWYFTLKLRKEEKQ